jgi:hypothetical protein
MKEVFHSICELLKYQLLSIDSHRIVMIFFDGLKADRSATEIMLINCFDCKFYFIMQRVLSNNISQYYQSVYCYSNILCLDDLLYDQSKMYEPCSGSDSCPLSVDRIYLCNISIEHNQIASISSIRDV